MKNNITYNYRFLLSVVLFVAAGFSLFGQQRTNPFEIKSRLNTVTDTSTISDLVPVAPLVTAIDTTVIESTDQLGVRSEVLLNPFDVDHVPIRKSAIAERAEKLQHQTDNTQYSNSFLIWVLLFSCLLIAILINLKSQLIGFVYKSILNENILKLFQREEHRGFNIYLLLLYFSFFINISVLVYLISTSFGVQKGIVSLFIIFGIITLIYILKHIGIQILGKIFLIEKSTDLYGFTIMIFNHAAGIILIPFNFMIAFAPHDISKVSLWIAIVILGVLLILRLLRSIIIVFEYISDRLFQIIVYLCTFEIAPVMILIKSIMYYS